MPGFLESAGSAIDTLKVNEIARTDRDGRAIWTKRRLPVSRLLVPVANLFFWFANNPVRVLRGADWQQWESDSFRRLHGSDFFVSVEPGAFVAAQVPGINLSELLERRQLSPAICSAAGRELRRAHLLFSEFFEGGWSHGDPHLGNFVYSLPEDRARLIDFEVRHDRMLPVTERHAHDLLTFLLDLSGRCRGEEWLSLSTAFVDGYSDTHVQETLKHRLGYPRGIAAIWWAIRSSYMNRAEVGRRLALLRDRL